jgi:hypothetical protein
MFLATVLCALFSIAGVISLLSYSVAQYTALPASMHGMGADIARLEDMAAIKKVCAVIVDAVSKNQNARNDLVWWGLGLMVLSSTLCGLMSAYAYISLRRTGSYSTQEVSEAHEISIRPITAFLSNAYAGKLKLWKAFWLVYLPGAILFPVVVWGLYAAVKKLNLVSSDGLTDFFVLPLLLAALWLWQIALCALVWRSSVNTKYPVLGSFARIAILLSVTVPVLKLVLIWVRLQSHLH